MTDVMFPIEGVSYPTNKERDGYKATSAWVQATAGDVLRATAMRVPNKTALITDDKNITYAELDVATEKLGAALVALGLCPGDRVLFQLGSVIETVIALFGCFKAGIVPVCSLPQYREIEMRALARLSDAKAWFVQSDYSGFDLVGFSKAVATEFTTLDHHIIVRGQAPAGMHEFNELIASQTEEQARAILAQVSIGVGDVLAFQLSGGTTSVPKIIPRCHGEYLGQARDWAHRTSMNTHSVSLYALPLIHNAGQVASLFPTILLGGTLILMQRMEPKTFFDWIVRERVTHSINIGPALAQMMDYTDVCNHDLSSVKLMSVFDRADLLERHLNVPCTNIFGITEGILMCSEPDAPEEARFGTVGRPVSEFDEVRILVPKLEQDVQFGEVGELCIKGPSTIRGYFRLPDDVNRASFTTDGFVRTGDLMRQRRVDNEVHYIFAGRLKENIDRGGEKFSAEEVESLIVRDLRVADAKVVAMPDKVYGEKACAFLIMQPGESLLTVRELSHFLIAQGLAKFKLPERIESIEAFPVTRVGKVDKSKLRKMIAERLNREKEQ